MTDPGTRPTTPDPVAARTRPDAAAERSDASATMRVQILSTEHWSLLATRSMTWNESFARAQMFLSVVSASVIALAFVQQTSGPSGGFTAFALVLLPVVLFLGVATYLRLVAVNQDEHRWVRGMNRIRAGYLGFAPDLEPYFVTSHHDDEKGIVATAGWRAGPTLHGFITTPAIVGVIDSVVAGVITFIAARALGLDAPWAAALAIAIGVLLSIALNVYEVRTGRRELQQPAISPTPEGE